MKYLGSLNVENIKELDNDYLQSICKTIESKDNIYICKRCLSIYKIETGDEIKYTDSYAYIPCPSCCYHIKTKNTFGKSNSLYNGIFMNIIRTRIQNREIKENMYKNLREACGNRKVYKILKKIISIEIEYASEECTRSLVLNPSEYIGDDEEEILYEIYSALNIEFIKCDGHSAITWHKLL